MAVGCTAFLIPFEQQSQTITYSTLTGDWVFQATSTSGPVAFVSMAGYINQAQSSGGTSDATAAFQLQSPGNCYVGATLVPWYGDVESPNFNLYSFDVNAQFITVTGTRNSAGTILTGTYAIDGGCANGAAGNFTATRYAAMNGSYASAAQSSVAVQLNLSESATGTGSGTFLITGSGSFGGVSCFTGGTLSGTSGSILGNAVTLDFTTNEATPSTLVVSGTIDPAASVFTVSSMQVSGGSCSGTWAP